MRKQLTAVLMVGILGAAWISMTGCGNGTASAKTDLTESKSDTAILVVSFGTSYNENRQVTIEAIEEAIEKECPDYEVRRAFTSQIIIDKLKERDGLEIDNVEEALDRAVEDGIARLVVQPTHLMDGYEYTDLADALKDYEGKFDKILLGQPLLSSEEDFEKVVKAIGEKTAAYDDGQTAICFMGHGTEADSNKVYPQMQDKLREGGYENYYIGTVEAEPTLDDVIAALKENGSYKKVVLEPLMVVAGDHANNDMAGDEEDSWKTILENEGYEVECILEGLGQIPAIRDIYVEHVKEAMSRTCYGQEPDTEMVPVYGSDLKDGSYEVQVESSSSMLRVVKAQLNVEQGKMTADLTLSGTGYLKLFMGTGEEALEAGEERYIPYDEDEEGAYVYSIPVEALNVEFSCAAYSKRKETWYDRELLIRSASLPEKAFRTGEEDGAALQLPVFDREDGEYTIEVSLEGGTGRASIVSPAAVQVQDGTAMVSLEWSSPDFDYMIFNEKKYRPVNSQGNSVFEIPLPALDTKLDVTADTIAMSSPHEISYIITFHGDTIKKAGG